MPTDEEKLAVHKQKWERLAIENDRYYVRSVDHEQSDEEYETSGWQNVESFILKDARLSPILNSLRYMTVLEIGCGSGRLSKNLAKVFGTVLGVDISREMIDKAQQFVANPRATFVESDGAKIPLASASADFAFSYIVYQHFPTIAAVQGSFQEVSRVLRPGSFAKLQVRGKAHPDPKEWSWGVYFSPHAATEMANTAGFDVIEITGAETRTMWLLMQKR